MRSPGSRGLEKLPVNYSRGLLREIPPIKPCGHLRRLRFAFSMHDDDGVCAYGVGGGKARVLSVHVQLKTWICVGHVRPRRRASSVLTALM